jgi:hypothetical protein
MDENIKKIMNLPLPRLKPVPKPYTGKPRGFPKLYTPPPGSLKALRAGAVPEGKVLNPYGQCGYSFRGLYRATFFKRTVKPAWRPEAMKRKRLKLLEKKAIQLEAHELQQLARENATAAMQTLIEISLNKRAPEATRIAASAHILDRGYGKASQTSITANVSNGKTSDLDSTELDKRISSALKRAEELTNRAPKAGTSKKRSTDFRFNN